MELEELFYYLYMEEQERKERERGTRRKERDKQCTYWKNKKILSIIYL